MPFISDRRRVLFSTALTATLSVLALPTMAQTTAPDTSDGIQDIVVTATRQAQVLSKVPISATAYDQQRLDRQGVRQIDDIYRLTPGVNFERTNLRSNISIRGISSTAGAATTGIYIDDTPIQVRTIGYSANNAYPAVFDLERIEVLRGPQGTLFGAGSQGGTIRFIQTSPNMNDTTAYARGELANTQGGDISYEGGVAFGAPIVEDKIGFRASAYFRRDGGYIDRVTGTPRVVSSNGSAGPDDSVAFDNIRMARKDSNSTETTSLRLAVAFQPTESLKITPSITYQRIKSPDSISLYWPSLSDEKNSDFRTPMWVPTVDANHVAIPDAPLTEPLRDRFLLPALAINFDMGPVELVSSTAYFDRKSRFEPNYTQLYQALYARRQVPNFGDYATSPQDNVQKNFTQEIRLQSTDTNARFTWVAGGFYTHNKQRSVQNSKVNFVQTVPSISSGTVPGFPPPLPAVNDGAPFGPGYSAYVNYYGMNPVNGVTTYYADLRSVDEQYAAFGEANFNVTERLKLTAGVRVSRNKVRMDAIYDGPNSNLNSPRGYACEPGTGLPGAAPCIPVAIGQYEPGEGPFAIAFANGGAGQAETAVTPKFGISYQATPRNLIYATVAKGFRPGGAQPRQPSACNDQLANYGYLDSSGRPVSPETYESDTVWSYEIGTKNRIGRVQFDASVYYIKWKNIQSLISLNTCAQSIIDNLGGATSKGFDLQAQWEALDGLVLSTAVGHNNSSYDQDTVLGGRMLFTDGSAVPGSGAPWTVTLSGQYDFTAGEQDVYLRADYTYAAAFRRTGSSDPDTATYDRMVPPRPETNMVNARIGMRQGGLDISVFMNNLLNAHPRLGLGRTNNQPVYTDYTFRPRTFGLTAAYRY